jgi:hypothetical protein
MSNELESDRAMARVMNLELESLESMVLVTMPVRLKPSRQVRQTRAVKITFQVTQIVRFLLERGLRFRNLGFCGHDTGDMI